MKPTHEMTLAEVTLAILKAAVNIPDGLYVHAARLAKRELATYGPDGNLVDATLTSLPDEPDFKSDENALEIFSKLMAHKMAKSAEKGRSGWQQCTQEDLSRMLREHVAKGDPVDVANFCMMLSANGFGIAKTVPPAGDVEVLACLTSGGRSLYFPSPSIEWREGDMKLVDRAHVTRLTAELDEATRGIQFEQAVKRRLEDQVVSLKTELTNAREAMLDVISNLGEFCCGLHSQEQVDYITSQLDKLAHQSVPAAKGEPKVRESLLKENQRVTPARFKCLACGEYHEGMSGLPCPKMSAYSQVKP